MAASDQHTTGSTAVGVAVVVLTLMGWTVTPLFIEHFTFGANRIDAWTSNGWRYGFAALLWAPLLVGLRLNGKWPVGVMKAALIPAAINGTAQVFFTLSFYRIDPAMVAFGLRAQMVFTAAGAAMLFPPERRIIRSAGFLAGIGAVVVGTGGTVYFQDAGLGEKADPLGVFFAICAGAGFAAYALSVRKCMTGYSSMVSFAAISQYTALIQIVLMLCFAERFGARALDLSAPQFGLLLLSAVIGIAAGHVLYYMSIERLGVAVSTGVIQLQPFTVAALSIPLFGEHLSAMQWVFGSVAVGGAMSMLRVQHRMRRAKRREMEALEYRDLPPDHVAAAAACEDEPKRG
ncbi:MAG: DMT family transporter [Phycisphaerales bacterium]